MQKHCIELQQKEIKNIALSILIDIKNFCEENAIKYYLTCGTLLGAARHSGFIPWDDDIDIMMPRPDYEKFINTYNGKYKLCNPKDGMFYYAKVYDQNTVKYERNIDYKKYKPIGIDVDVFPLDGMINERDIINKTLKRMKLLELLLLLSNEPIFYRKNPLKAINRIIPRIIGSKNIVKIIEKNAKKYDYSSSNYVMRIRNTRNGKDTAYSKEILEPSTQLEFEGIKFTVPGKYDEWLKMFYGDYNVLPEESKRKSSHSFKCYMMKDK